MAETTIDGLNATVSRGSDLDQYHLKEDTFTADLAWATVPTTGFVDAGNQTHAHVGFGISGTITGTGTFDAATTAPFPTTAIALATTPPVGTLTLQFTTACTLAVKALYTGIGMVRPENGKLDIVQSWIGSGVVTTAWDEA